MDWEVIMEFYEALIGEDNNQKNILQYQINKKTNLKFPNGFVSKFVFLL